MSDTGDAVCGTERATSDTESSASDTESSASDTESGAETGMKDVGTGELLPAVSPAVRDDEKSNGRQSKAAKIKEKFHLSPRGTEIARHSLQLAMGAVELVGEIKDFVPYVGPAFKIVHSILGIVQVCQGAETAKTTTDILIDIQGELTTIIEDLKKIPGQTVLQGRVDEYYSQIKVSAKLCSDVSPELQKRILNDLFVKLWYLDDRIVQEGLETTFWLKSLFPNQDSPDESASTNFDPNWGFEAIYTKFFKVFVQQQKAISVLNFYGIEHAAVHSFDNRLKNQLHLFWKMCRAEWNKKVGLLHSAHHEIDYDQDYKIEDMVVFATESEDSTFLTRLFGFANTTFLITIESFDLKKIFIKVAQMNQFKHQRVSNECEEFFGFKLTSSECKQLLSKFFSCTKKCQQIICYKQFICILHSSSREITIVDLKDSTNVAKELKGSIKLFAIANDHIYILYSKDSSSVIYHIGSIEDFFSHKNLDYREFKRERKVRAMAGHGTCLYIVRGTAIEVYYTTIEVCDTEEEPVKAEWPIEGSEENQFHGILKDAKNDNVFLLSVGSSLCLRVDKKKKMLFYFIKPIWPYLNESSKFKNSFIK